MGNIIVYRDDREKLPWDTQWWGAGFEIIIKRIPVGDYTIKGHSKGFVIERKQSWLELYGSMQHTRTRFDKVLKYLALIPHGYIVVEQEWDKLNRVYTPKGKVSMQILHRMVATILEKKIPIIAINRSDNHVIKELVRTIHAK